MKVIVTESQYINITEMIRLDIKVGDTLMGGKFKNKKVIVKTIGKNDKGDITINGKPLLRFRLLKEDSYESKLSDKVDKLGVVVVSQMVGGFEKLFKYVGDNGNVMSFKEMLLLAFKETKKFILERPHFQKRDYSEFKNVFVSIMTDELHNELTFGGTEDFDFDYVYDQLNELFDEEIYDFYKRIIDNIVIEEDSKSPSVVTTTSAYKKGNELRGSEWLMSFIRNEEGDPKKKGQPILKAYKKAGDVWTIGYGHTTGDNEPKVTPGMVISSSKALSIMNNDLTYSADCVRRIFQEWEANGINVPITQNMFDVLVSLVYNSGCGSVRMSDFIQSLKKGKYKKTAEQIKTFNLKSGFGGLVTRREIESKKFLE